MNARVKGSCPMGCGETLFLGSGGYVTCSSLSCPRPDAASSILEDSEVGHILHVDVITQTRTLRHPLYERLDDALFSCALADAVDQLDERFAGIFAAGDYRVTKRSGLLGDGGWAVEELQR